MSTAAEVSCGQNAMSVARSAPLALALALATPACGGPALDALVTAYPDHFDSYDNKDVIWRTSTSALAAGDIELVQSFVALARDRNVSINPILVDRVPAVADGARVP